MATPTEQIARLADRQYQYGFVTAIEADSVPPGLNEDIVRMISQRKGEPDWLLDWRLKAYRNWLTMATMALLGGVEMIRVGIEDQFYLYPHRDEISQKASDTTEIVVKLAKALGREVATPQDVRDRVGIKLTK